MKTLSSSDSYCNGNHDDCLPVAHKRRRLEAVPREIRPFVKTPFTSMMFIPIEAIRETLDACHSERVIAMNKDLVWSLSLSRIHSVPMWLGYNCKISLDHSKTQTVEYLSPINESPTTLAIVQQKL